MKMRIKRVSSRADGTFGVLMAGDAPFALTCERPWVNNEVGKSCIPLGEYLCKRVDSPKFGDTFEVTGVPGRSEILFHKGNVDDDSRGCILIGEEFATWSDGSVSVANSGHAFMEFLDRLDRVNEFTLEVT